MSTATITAKQVIEEYIKALSGNTKTPELIDQWVDDPNLKKHILDFDASFANYDLVPHQIVAEGDTVAVNATATGVHTGTFAGIPPTGKSITVGAMMFYQVANGRIVKSSMQADLLGGMNQLKS